MLEYFTTLFTHTFYAVVTVLTVFFACVFVGNVIFATFTWSQKLGVDLLKKSGF